MPTLNHLWQRFLLASSLLVGLAIGVAATVFGYSNLRAVDVQWSIFHIKGVPLWTVALVPVALVLIAGTLYHWVDGLHHFTEHMRHRGRVHELETELASLRSRLDQVLEMPDHGAMELPAEEKVAVALPPPDEEMAAALKPNGGSANGTKRARSRERATLPTREPEIVAETEPVAPHPEA